MNLLVTNDDGIGSVFLHELVRALRAEGHTLYVVAPKIEQSWIGAAKSRHRPVTSAKIDAGLGCETWSVDGTPSDCVNIGLAHLLPRDHRIEAVVSGINIGRNTSLGFILASGTIGGAWEGAVHGYPAIAFSQEMSPPLFERLRKAQGQPEADLLATVRISAARAARMVPSLTASTAASSFIVHNINFPLACQPDAEVVRTIPAHIIVSGLFSPAADDGTHRFIFKEGKDCSPPNQITDHQAIQSGRISHTVLDYRVLGNPSAASLEGHASSRPG